MPTLSFKRLRLLVVSAVMVFTGIVTGATVLVPAADAATTITAASTGRIIETDTGLCATDHGGHARAGDAVFENYCAGNNAQGNASQHWREYKATTGKEKGKYQFQLWGHTGLCIGSSKNKAVLAKCSPTTWFTVSQDKPYGTDAYTLKLGSRFLVFQGFITSGPHKGDNAQTQLYYPAKPPTGKNDYERVFFL